MKCDFKVITLIITLISVILLGAYVDVNAQYINRCELLDDTSYLIKDRIDNKIYKSQSFQITDDIKRSLLEQIGSTITSVSQNVQSNVTLGQVGNYTSVGINEFIASSSGIIHNPKITYCKDGIFRKYVIVSINKNKFYESLYNSIIIRNNLFSGRIENFVKYDELSLKTEASQLQITNLSRDRDYLISGLSMLATSSSFSQSSFDSLSLEVSKTLKLYDNIIVKNQSIIDRDLNTMQRFIIDQPPKYEEIANLIEMIDYGLFSQTQLSKYDKILQLYNRKLNEEAGKYEESIEKAILQRNRKDGLLALEQYSKYTLTPDLKNRKESYERQLDRRTSPARTSIFGEIVMSNDYVSMLDSEGKVNIEHTYNQYEYQINNSFRIGLKHYFSNPFKRRGLSVQYYKNFRLKESSSKSELNTGNLKLDKALQAGLHFGIFDFLYGPILENDKNNKYYIATFKISLLRSDIITGSKSLKNYVNLQLFTDILTDHKDQYLNRVGITINANIVFNRDAKYK